MPPKSVLIVGGGVVAWMTANLLVRALAPIGWPISVIEDESIADSAGLPMAVEYLSPRALEQLAALGIDEDTVLGVSDGAVTYGNAFIDWRGPGTAFQALGGIGAPLGVVGFHQLVAKLRAENKVINVADYALGALCAQTNRYARSHADDRGVLSTLVFGLHVDAAALAAWLRRDSLARGVRLISAHVCGVDRESDDMVAGMRLADDEQLSADLFIDCTGAAAKLCDGGWTDWMGWLPCDRIATATRDTASPPLSYGHVEAHEAGWQRFVSIDGTVDETYVFRSSTAHSVIDNARPFASGRRTAPWRGNCLAIGGAAVVIDSPLNPQLELVVAAVNRLIGLLPTTRDCVSEAREYNRQTIGEHESARDIAILVDRVRQRNGVTFWDNFSEMLVPESLERKINLFRSRGRIALYDDEIFEERDWVALFEAMGLRARDYDVQADSFSRAEIDKHLDKIRAVMLSAVAAMPTHDAYLRSLRR
jgi:tryptophan halogenase